MDTDVGSEPCSIKAVELMSMQELVQSGLITNGSRFTEESSIRLLEAQVDMIEFSVVLLTTKHMQR
jgi:predicted lysophospholipase L1 biosynthesis ABC-type transport system permease subunit